MGSTAGEYAGVNPLEPAAVTDAAGLVWLLLYGGVGLGLLGMALQRDPRFTRGVAFTLGHGRQRLGVGAEFVVVGMSAEWFNDPVE